jgi:AraC family transcriptional regulator
MEMRDENTLPAMFPMMSMRVDGPRGPIIPSRPNQSPNSVAPVSAGVGDLLMLAMILFESNREVAWRCLTDASALLGRQSEAIGTSASPSQAILRLGGLAPWQANRALEYIEGNLGSKMTIREIADQVALSTSHFSRAFKQSLGCSPITYVAMRRVERAKLMMTSTRERLAAIALACGFADQSHFCRQFRRAIGISPSLWRRISIRKPARVR